MNKKTRDLLLSITSKGLMGVQMGLGAVQFGLDAVQHSLRGAQMELEVRRKSLTYEEMEDLMRRHGWQAARNTKKDTVVFDIETAPRPPTPESISKGLRVVDDVNGLGWC